MNIFKLLKSTNNKPFTFIFWLLTLSSIKFSTAFTTSPSKNSNCKLLKNGPSYTKDMEKANATFVYFTDKNIQQVNITCSEYFSPKGTILSSEDNLYLSLTIINTDEPPTTYDAFSITTGYKPISVTLNCGTDGFWHQDDDFVNQLREIIYCEICSGASKNVESTDAANTKSVKNSDEKIDKLTTTNSSKNAECSKEGFQILSSAADPPSAAENGRFVGYYRSRKTCQEVCKVIHGFLKCTGYMYEPKNNGKCTIFENLVDGKITENTDSVATVYKKC